jgi:hypothetical protein
MKTKTSLLRWLTIAAGLCAASDFVSGASSLTFTDSWKDTGAYDSSSQTYYVKTTGSFSTTISLPLNGVDLSQADAGTMFSLSIGPAGSTTTIVSDTLGDAESYSPSKKSAKFPLTDPNTGDTIGSVTVSWTTTTISVTGSATEDVVGLEQLFAGESDGTPHTYNLASSKSGIYGEVSLGLDASDNGGGTYTNDNPFVPVTGSDKETEYNPPDGSGPAPLETGSVTGTGDFTPPKLSITSPVADFKVYNANSIIDLKGTASDSLGITNIQCIVDGDTNSPIQVDQINDLPTNSIAWTISDLDFSQVGQVGTNIVTVVAYDSAGNQTTVSRTFFWIQTNAALVTVSPSGSGTVKGLKTGQLLDVGSAYAVSATAANKNWIFSQWTDGLGDVLSSNATFDFFDTNGGSLTADFVPNPFTNADLAGTYRALYYDTNNGAEVRNAGYITITVTGTGAFSGTFLNADYGKSTTKLSGQLSVAPDGSLATATLPFIQLGKQAYFQVILQVATDPILTDPGAGLLTGFVNAYSSPTDTNPPYAAEIQGELSFYNTNTLPGLYNVVIAPVSTDPSQGPGGYSYGSATVSDKKGGVGAVGAVTLVLNLADGTSPAISFSTGLAQDGTCPFYASLYGGNGIIFGWMQFATDGSGTMSPANITWLTAFDYTSHTYTNGFNGQPILSGGLYLPPKAGTNLFGEGMTALTFEIDPGYAGLSLPNEVDDSVIFNPARNTFTDTSKVTITLTATTGALTGTFYPAGSRTALSYKGVEIGGVAYGFYKNTANLETGPIWVAVP